MATLLPNGKQFFNDSDGKPLSGASVAYYTPGTTDFKPTYQDAAATILNTNPVILDASGEAVVYGTGAYRQVVTDAAGNLIWDQETSEPGSQIDSITVGGDLSVSGTSSLSTVNVSGDLNTSNITASGGVTVSGDLTVDGLVTAPGTSNFGTATIDNLIVNVNSNLSTTNLTGNLGVTGDLFVSGISSAGDTTLTTLTVTGGITGSAVGWSLFPTGTGAFSGPYTVGINVTSAVLAGSFIAASDVRVKTEIEDVPFAEAYRFVREIRAKLFLKDGSPDAGYIAQDAILHGFQRMVVVNDTADPRMAVGDDVSPIGKRLNLNYNHATAYHHRMIDYLLDRVDDLQKQISLLKN
jgi:hypothetical protein